MNLASSLAALALLGVLFLTSLADAALRAINQVRLRGLLEKGVSRASAVRQLLEHPHRIVATTLIVNTFALVALAAITVLGAVALAPGGGARSLAVVTAAILLALGVLIFFQLVPRALAQRDPERTAILLTRPLSVLYVLISPIAWAAERLANAAVRLVGIEDAPDNPYVTEDDLQMLVNAGEQEGVIERVEREMITGILAFGDKTAREIMVPRPDIVAVPASLTPREALRVALDAGHSRIPVYGESPDEVRGILYAKDLIGAVLEGRRQPLAQLARQPIVIPESKRLGELLHELRAARVHMAVVVDEYGGLAGIVTFEDLLEEIVGEIHDEYDTETPQIERVAPDEWVAEARIDLDEVNELLGVVLDSEGYDSLGGYVTAQLERLPEPGDAVEAQGIRMTVLDTQQRRVGRVRLQQLPPPAEGNGG